MFFATVSLMSLLPSKDIVVRSRYMYHQTRHVHDLPLPGQALPTKSNQDQYIC